MFDGQNNCFFTSQYSLTLRPGPVGGVGKGIMECIGLRRGRILIGVEIVGLLDRVAELLLKILPEFQIAELLPGGGLLPDLSKIRPIDEPANCHCRLLSA
jgi:hypothetical protein